MRVLPILLLVALPLRADDEGAKVYKKVLPSVVWIHAKHDRGIATGSGSIVDAERRLVVTNYHVVEDQPTVKLYFPAYRDGQPIAEKQYYTDRAKSLALTGKVIARDKKADLALVQLESLPEEKKAIPLAPTSTEPGSSVHSIGNTGKSGALWGYVPGKVRQVYHKDWKADLGGRTMTFHAKVVETDSATNPGDSGGPLVNDKGELVAVTEGGAVNAQLLSTFVDVSEVKKLLDHDDIRKIKGGKGILRRRDKPTVIVDGAKLFSEATIKKAQTLINDLHDSKKFDVLVETSGTAPADELDSVRKMTTAERTLFMRNWLRQRMAAESVHDAGLLICNDPKSLYFDLTVAARQLYPASIQATVRDSLIEGLKTQKADDALIAALESLRDTHGKK